MGIKDLNLSERVELAMGSVGASSPILLLNVAFANNLLPLSEYVVAAVSSIWLVASYMIYRRVGNSLDEPCCPGTVY